MIAYFGDVINAICGVFVLAWLVAVLAVGYILSTPSNPSDWPKAAVAYYAAHPEEGQKAIIREWENRRAFWRVLALVLAMGIILIMASI